MTTMPVNDAARALGIRPGTLRRLCRQGLPHQPGRKGRGCTTLVDIERARQWIAQPLDQQQLLTLADDIPRILARATFACWQQIEGPSKRTAAGHFAALWYTGTTALLDQLREQNPAIPEVQASPPEIDRLRKIALGH